MTLTLYCSLTSPYARRVRVMARVLGAVDDIREAVVNPFDSPDALLAHNPLSKIPVLVGPDELVLPDSGLILGYLLARQGRAMPAAAGDWERARRLTIAEGVVDACAAIVLEGRRPTGQRSQAHVDRQRGVIARGLAAVAAEPPEQSPADADPYAITVAVLLGYLDFRLPTVDWRSSAPSLVGWYADAAALPAMQATRPPEG